LRDHFKSTGSMLVLMVAPGAALPTELSQDVLVLDEPLPSAEDLARIVKETFAAAEIDEPALDVGRRAVDAPGSRHFRLSRRLRCRSRRVASIRNSFGSESGR
jgi:hypothetical protein